jgi:hypothetical protein
MSPNTSADRRDGDDHHAPRTHRFGTGIVAARRVRGAGDVAGRQAPAILSECSSASRRSALLRPRTAGLTVLTPIPRSPSGRLLATARVFDAARPIPTHAVARRYYRASEDAA